VRVAAVLRPADYESRLQRYLFERSEEGCSPKAGVRSPGTVGRTVECASSPGSTSRTCGAMDSTAQWGFARST